MNQATGKKIKDLKLFTLKQGNQERKVEPGHDFEPFDRNPDLSVVKRFEQQVERYPGSLAVQCGEQSFTYEELNRTANLLGWRICQETGEKMAGIALLFEHGMDMITAIFGTLKAGKYYIPLDPLFPLKRLLYILKDSHVKVLLTNEKNLALAEQVVRELDHPVTVINLYPLDESLPVANLDIDINPGQPLYILYTSGSTGRPKGVVQAHRHLLYFIRVYTDRLHLYSQDRLSLLASYCFDAAGMDIYGALLNGATLYPLDIKQPGNLKRLPAWLQENGITVYHSVPTVYRYLTDLLEGGETFANLRVLVMGGEPVHKKDVEKYKQYFSNECLFVNLFGSTEASIALLHVMDKTVDISRETVPIGFPVEEMDIRLVNPEREYDRLHRSNSSENDGYNNDGYIEQMNMAPRAFATGEIVYHCHYLALGYLNDPGKTNTVLLEAQEPGNKRFYCTGDLGKCLPDGMIEYLGRKDFQVKIRGYRVELGEIESILNRIPGITKSAAVCHLDQRGESYLVAYYLVDLTTGIAMTEWELKKRARELLPDYMVPSLFIELERFPLTSTGKIDRKSLPQPDDSRLPAFTSGKPGTETEEKMRVIWGEILGLDIRHIGLDANFFDLGGHSLKVTLLLSRVHKELGVKIPLTEFFNHPTIAELAEYAKKTNRDSFIAIEPAQIKDYYMLSPAQRRLYFYQQIHGGIAYNMPEFHLLEPSFQIEKIEIAFKDLIKRHESLRTSFILQEGEPVQWIHPMHTPAVVDFSIERFSPGPGDAGNGSAGDFDHAVNDIIKRFVRPFDLAQSPLLRVGIAQLKKNSQEHVLLLIDMHHIISDGVSHSILVQDFFSLYDGISLPPLKLQYRDYSEWLHQQRQDGVLKHQEGFWLKKFQGDCPILDLPCDFQRPTVQSFAGSRIDFTVAPGPTERLRMLALTSDATMFMVLLAIYAVLLSKLSGQEDIVIGTVVAGRNHADLERIIGMFVNPLALRYSPTGDKTFKKFLEKVKAGAIESFENQDFPFDELVEKVVRKRDFSRQPIYSAGFSLEKSESQTSATAPGTSTTGRLAFKKDTSRIDLNLLGTETTEQLFFKLEYCTDLFKKETVERFADYFQYIIQQVTANPGLKLEEIDIIPDAEKNLLQQTIRETRESLQVDFDL